MQGQNYVTVFIDVERGDNPVIFATPGKDQAALARFCEHIEAQGGSTDGVWEVVCDMSQAFQAGVGEMLPNASLTTDWFHVVGRVTDAMNAVRKAEAKAIDLPKGARWATLKGGEREQTDNQEQALAQLEAMGTATADAYAIKEKLRWVRAAATPQAARWRLTRFLNLAKDWVGETPLLEPMRTALATIEYQFESIIQRWHSSLLQRPLGRAQQYLPGRPSMRPRLPQPANLHHHDLHVGRAYRRHRKIHLVRRSAPLIGAEESTLASQASSRVTGAHHSPNSGRPRLAPELNQTVLRLSRSFARASCIRMYPKFPQPSSSTAWRGLHTTVEMALPSGSTGVVEGSLTDAQYRIWTALARCDPTI